MIHRVENRHLGTKLFYAMEKLAGLSRMNILPRQGREKPGRSLKKISVGILHARLLFAGHGMPSDKRCPAVFPNDLAARFVTSAFVLPTSVTSVRGESAEPSRSM